MSPVGAPEARRPGLLRDRSGAQRVTNIELFFDLVYVFAVTQLSHYLLGHADLRGALRAALLLLMVWLVWAYTTWVTNWLDPDLMAVRGGRGRRRRRVRPDPARTAHAGLNRYGLRPTPQ